MRLLIDTQALIWFALNDSKLAPTARQHIVEPSNVRFVSLATVWEMAIKIAKGKLDLGSDARGSTSLNQFIALLPLNDIALLPIAPEDAVAVADFPIFPDHGDPFDRLIAAQCLNQDLTLISIDRAFDLYGVRRLWG